MPKSGKFLAEITEMLLGSFDFNSNKANAAFGA